jgi:hypothetical protein
VAEQLGLALTQAHELGGDRVALRVEPAHLRLRFEADLEALEVHVEPDRTRLTRARIAVELEHAESANAPVLRRVLPAVDLDVRRRGDALVPPGRCAVVAHGHRTHGVLPAGMLSKFSAALMAIPGAAVLGVDRTRRADGASSGCAKKKARPGAACGPHSSPSRDRRVIQVEERRGEFRSYRHVHGGIHHARACHRRCGEERASPSIEMQAGPGV